MPIPEDKKVDHLILLVGGNPLPNYVAARLLGRKGTQLHIIHTQKTADIAQRIWLALRRPVETESLGAAFPQPIYKVVDENDPANIFKVVSEVAKSANGQSIGLNYTGGNRPMSVHGYSAVQQTRPDAVFSYLNGQTMQLLIHDANRASKLIRADKELNMRLETLLKLQGLTANKPDPTSDPLQLPLVLELAKLHSVESGVNLWQAWGSGRNNKSKNWEILPRDEQGLERIETALTNMCDGNPTPKLVAQKLGHENLQECAKWLNTEWLEEYVLHCAKEAANARNKAYNDTQDVLKGISRTRIRDKNTDKFELDVALMRSYQFFVFSCIASHRDDACKFHAMEAYVRARQAGGDEARVGLVCLHKNPKNLENKLASDLDAGGKIKVFGQGQLLILQDEIKLWLDSQP